MPNKQKCQSSEERKVYRKGQASSKGGSYARDLNSLMVFREGFFKIIYLFILFMAVFGLRFCARAFSSCGKWGPLFVAVRGPLTVVASVVAEHRLQKRRLSNCGSRA